MTAGRRSSRRCAHLKTAVLVCEQYDLGRDSAYNAAFLLSLSRRHGLNRHAHDLWAESGWPELANGVAAYGADEYRRIQKATSRRAIEQMLLLACEVCFAALADGEVGLFREFTENVANGANDLGGRLPLDLKRKLGRLSVRAKELGRTTHVWGEAIEELKHL